ncbi:MAG: hypothetical protein HRU26_09270, partial [Psychroserpens sp.]|nr:hypothetical protein [Psychroserpens sp.]
MTHSSTSKKKIGIVLSTVPGYSETFFRNKIKGLRQHGMEVTLFVDYGNTSPSDQVACKVVVAPEFEGSLFMKFSRVVPVILKLLFKTPGRARILYQLEKKDGRSFKNRLKNLLRNQFFLEHDLDWIHFGY